MVKENADIPLKDGLARAWGATQVLLKSDPDAERLMRRFLAEGEDINRSE